MNARQSICLFIVVSIIACAFAGSSSAGAIKLRKLRRSSDSSRTSASSSSAATKQVSDKSTSDAAFDVTRALIKTAKALARSHSTSEVLTLNLTNLLILVVLKAIIFGIGLFYFGGISFKGNHGDGGHQGGGWGPGHGRSLVEKSKPFMSQGELLLVMTYILGAAENDNYECMYRVACEDPNQAKDYLKASKMIMTGVKYAKKFLSVNPKYEDIVRGLQDAVAHKANGGDCKKRYTCKDVPNL
ncbi:hypothetical protein Ocin01_13407 [Orchesella cincta]|uniref:Uncharacterized protein n=1 Tax=Orchesella cincta TaxID=48709 RepID=A0A1D2MJX9_ORCCI|nr:hypothetical protein Ocin01_13407 [Orchesella cincta]